jgi:hypothetical protein
VIAELTCGKDTVGASALVQRLTQKAEL